MTKKTIFNLSCNVYNVCTRSPGPLYAIIYYINWVKTSWTYSTYINSFIVTGVKLSYNSKLHHSCDVSLRPYLSVKSLSSVSPAAMSVLQQQLISQLALMNGLVDGQANMGQPPPSNNQQQTTAVHPAFMLQEQVSKK